MLHGAVPKYLKFLFAICKDLTTAQVEDMKFLCRQNVPCGLLEQATDAVRLVKLLQSTLLIREENLDFLHELLINIGRLDLAEKVAQFSESDSWSLSEKVVPDCKTITTQARPGKQG